MSQLGFALSGHDRIAPMAPGSRVTCRYRGDHVGTVLAIDDPQVWAGSLAFPEVNPDPGSVREHVSRCLSRGLLLDKIPVLWDFGRVYWDRDLTEAA